MVGSQIRDFTSIAFESSHVNRAITLIVVDFSWLISCLVLNLAEILLGLSMHWRDSNNRQEKVDKFNLLMENISAALFVLMILFMPLMCTWLINSILILVVDK